MPRTLPLVWLVACGGGEGKGRGEPTDPPTDSGTTPPAGGPLFGEIGASLHPDYGTLVRVDWHQAARATVHLEFEAEGVGHRSPSRDLPAGDHAEWLLGVPYDTDGTFRIVAEGGEATDASPFRTGPLPQDYPPAVVTVDEPAGQDAASPWVLLSVTVPHGFIGDRWWVQIVGRDGRPVWAWKTPPGHTTMHAGLSADGGSVLIDRNSWWGSFDLGLTSSVDRMTLTGAVLESWDTPGLHHDFLELPDGHLVYGAYRGWGYDEEELMEIAPDRSERVVLSCRDFLSRHGGGNCGSNTITYDAGRDHLLWTLFTVETALDLDRRTGEVQRWFGHVPGSWAFDPPSAQMWYAHGSVFTDTGTLLVSTHATAAGEETVVREYALDEGAETLRLVWDFGVGDGVWGAQLGEAHRLPGGNTLHNLGTYARLREARPDRSVVWDLEWPDSVIGHSVPVADLYALVGDRP